MSDISTGPLPDDEREQVEQVQQVEQVTAEDVDDAALDLDRVEGDLADVELALARLDAGTYWTDEVTGGVIPDEVLAEHPTARRSGSR